MRSRGIEVHVSQKSYFPVVQGAIVMKTILLTVVLAVAVGAWEPQVDAQPAQGQSAAPPTSSVNPPTGSVNPPTGSVNPPTGSVNPPTGSVDPPTGQTTQTSQTTSTGQTTQNAPAAAPVIKDPAEYNAYVAAVQQKDNNAKISGLEAFLTQYPNSVMKNQALELLMGAYQGANNVKKTLETATKLVTADPCNMRGLALLAYFDRVLAQGGDPNAAQLLTDGKKYGEQGMDCWPKVTDPEITKMKDQMTNIFKAAIGMADLQAKDYSGAIENLKAAADGNPTDFSVVYPLALAYWPDPKTPTTPANTRNAIWYAARASAVAPAQSQAAIEKYARSLYVRFHNSDDGWPAALAKAKAGTAAPSEADLTALIPPAPTPADQAHGMVVQTPPDKMDFATWEFVLTNGAQADQDAVWNAIKGKPIAMNGTVISTEPETFMIAGSSDDIDAKKADITLKFEDKVPTRLIPKDGASFDFEGEPSSYTPNPFMMTMEKGRLVNTKPAAPAHKPTHKAASQ
jgi:tetratricopeptide (TPR) repeat protein